MNASIRSSLARVGSALLLSCLFAAPATAGIVVEDYGSITHSFRGQAQFTTIGRYDPRDDYSVANGTPGSGFARLEPLHPLALQRGGTDALLQRLRSEFTAAAGWSFVAAPKDLSEGSLAVRTYDADAPEDAGEGTLCTREPTCVGARIHVEYRPHGDDPTANVHWIQVIRSNHAQPENEHGQNEYKVDIIGPEDGPVPGVLPPGFDPDIGQTNPFYDYLFGADGRHFTDYAARGDEDLDHQWIADLYLVVGGITPGVVTVYNGLQWGWINEFRADGSTLPEPGTLALLLAAIALLPARSRR